MIERGNFLNKTTVKQSYANMAQLMKKSNGAFMTALLLALVPIVIICCYSFYVVYGGAGLNYSVIDGFNLNSMLAGSTDAIMKFQEAMLKVFPDVSYEQSFGDVALDIINTLLIIVFDAFIILKAVSIVFEKEYSTTAILKQSLKKIPVVLFFSIFASWIVYEVQAMIYSSVFMIFVSNRLNSAMFLYTSIISTVMITLLSLLVSVWILLFVRYMTIAAVSGRCRFLVAFGYAKEILKGNTWRTMFRIMPFVLLGFIMPAFLQAIAIAIGDNITVSVALVAISAIIELFGFWLMWIYTIPEFFYFEKHSGIQQKIQEAIERVMEMRNSKENEDTNNEDNEKE